MSDESLPKYYFGHLSDRSFVNLSKEILEKKEFMDLEIIDGPGDRGSDIIGDECFKTGLGVEKRRCLIQCKHYAKSGRNVSDEEIRTARGSMSQRGCKSVLVITSTTLSPQAKHTVRHFREKEEIPFNYWDAEYLSELLGNQSFREIKKKYNIGTLFGAVARSIDELYMNVALFYGADAKPICIDFDKVPFDEVSNGVGVERSPPWLKLTGLNRSSNVKLFQYGGIDYVQDKFWQNYATFLFRKERLVTQELLNKYVSNEYEKRGKPSKFPLDLHWQGDTLGLLMSPPLEQGLYGISWEINDKSETYDSVKEVKEAFCRFVSKHISEVEKGTEWFVALFSNPVNSCHVEGASKLRTSMLVLPEYKNFFDPRPVDNDWIGLPDGTVDEKTKWLFGLAPSYSEYGSADIFTKIDPKKEIESHVSIIPKRHIRDFHYGTMTYGDLTNIPDLRARWFSNIIFYLRPPKIDDQKFIEEVLAYWNKEKKSATAENLIQPDFSTSKIDVTVPGTIQNEVSEFEVYVGGDPWTTDPKFRAFCKERELTGYDTLGSVFILISLDFKTTSIEPSYVLSDKISCEADGIARGIEEKISQTFDFQFERRTLDRRKAYFDFHNK